MGFLKSLSKSIKKSTPQQASGDDIGNVSEFGTLDIRAVVQEHAGIKRPSGQGDIAKRGRRRSSEKTEVAVHGLEIRDTSALHSVQLVPAPAISASIHTLRSESRDGQGQEHQGVQRDSHASPGLGLAPSDACLSSAPPTSATPRTMDDAAFPRGIIITPSSPIKPATQRDESHHSSYTRSTGLYAIHDLRQDHGDSSSNVLLDHIGSNSNTYNLGKGQPTKPRRPLFSVITASELPSQPYSPNGLLTPEPLLSAGLQTYRSASLPIEAQQNATLLSKSLQARSLSSAASQISPRFLSADDTWSDKEQRGPTLDRKAIRKTRSFSEVLSRNRRVRSDNEVDPGQRPIITWKSESKTRIVETPDTVTPPSISQNSSPKKKSINILQTAVDFFQFRKSRSRASSDAGKDMPLGNHSRGSNVLDNVPVDREATAVINSGLIPSMSAATVPIDTSKSTALMNVEHVTTLPGSTWSAAKGLAELTVHEGSHVARTTPKASPDPRELEDGVKGLFTTFGDSEGTTYHHQHMENGPATLVASSSTISQSRMHSPVDESFNSSMLSLPRAKMMSLTDASFKRPHMSPRAHSANSTSQSSNTSPASEAFPGSWHGTRPRSEASVSRSTTIRAALPSHSQRSPDTHATCLSSSLNTTRQNSVDGLALESSEPMSILRSSVPVHMPTTPVVGSPSVSFAGGTPRMSISSTTSRAESATSSGRPRGYTSVSQDNFHNALSLPVANSKSARPRSSTLFSTTPGWLATGTINSPEKKRSGVMRRLSAGLTGNLDENKRTPFLTSTQDSSRQASDYFGTGDPAPSPTAVPLRELPDRQPGTTTGEWMAQLSQMIPRSSLASVLASKQGPEFQEGLHLLLQGFHFDNLPLDIALRRFLMDMALPREAQQIDRVLEAFAQRYNVCHPGLFRDPDHAYVLAFSLIMLHTDVYNRHNKQKMTKAEYVRNTRLDGVSPVVLEIFHENTCFSEFTFADRANSEMDRNSVNRPRNNRRSTLFFTKSAYDSQAALPDRHGFQTAVAAGNVTYLQVPSVKWIPKDDPMSFIGSWRTLDEDWVESCFLSAPSIEVVKTVANSTPSVRGRNVNFDKEHPSLPHDVSPIVLRLKVVKVGLLSCKDDLLSTGKKSNNKKWRSWSVILTNTQLIFLKDSIWALALGEQIERLGPDLYLSPGTLLLPAFTDFKPDEVIGLNGSAAVFDRSYTKNENTFRLAMPLGLEYMLQANDELEMNEWVTLINWSAASKTLGIPTTNDSSGANLPPNTFDNYRDVSSDIAGSFQLDRNAKAESVDTQNRGSSSDYPFMELLNLNAANEALLQEYQARSTSLMSKIEEELRMARNLELLAILSQSSREHIESLFQLMAENIRRWRAELAKLRSIHIRQRPHRASTTPHHRNRC